MQLHVMLCSFPKYGIRRYVVICSKGLQIANSLGGCVTQTPYFFSFIFVIFTKLGPRLEPYFIQSEMYCLTIDSITTSCQIRRGVVPIMHN